MNSSARELPDAEPRRGLTGWALAALVALVGIETLLLLSAFSTKELHASEHPLLRSLQSLWLAPKMVVPILAAVFLFGQEKLLEEWRLLSATPRRTWTWVLAQVSAFAVFFVLSAQVLGRGNSDWAELWFGSGLVTGILSVLLIVPPRALPPLLRRNAAALGFACAIGAVAFVAGRTATSNLWDPLRVSTLHVSHALLDVVSDDIVLREDEFILGTNDFLCRISPECSGFEGIGLILVFLGSALWIFRQEFRFPRAWLMLLIGVPFVWLANSVRITTLIWVGTWISPRLAAEGFHSIAGITLFCVIALGMLTFARRSRFFSRVEFEPGPNWTAVYLSPFLVAVAVALLLSAFSSGLDTLYPLRTAGVAGFVFLWRDRLPKIRWRPTLIAWQHGVAGFLIWMAALYIRQGAPTSVEVQSEWQSLPLAWATFWILFRIVGTVWMAPLTEELAFRGYLMRRLCDADFSRVPLERVSLLAICASSLLFGITHPLWIAATLCGLLFAAAQIRGRSLSDAVGAHAVTNGLLVAYALATGDWSVWL